MMYIWAEIIAVVFVLYLVSRCFKVIPQGETKVIERLGKYHKTLESGINFVMPFIDRPRALYWRTSSKVQGDNIITPTRLTTSIDLREQVYDYPKQNVITKDNVNIAIDALLYFQITDPMKAVYEVADLPNAIEKLTQTTLRNVLGALELDESLTSRDTINSKLTSILDEATDKWGVKINRVEIKDIVPPADIREQMEKQMRAERDKRANILIAEGEKQTKILEAEGFRTAEVNKAEGEKQSEILRAQGDAEAKVIRAKADAESVKAVCDAFGGNSDAASKYLIAMNYIEKLGQMVEGKDNKVVYMPYEATAALSSLGGIKEIFTKAN